MSSFEGSLSQTALPKVHFDLLKPLRSWLDNLKVTDATLARRIAQVIPAQCPFEREVKVLGKTVAHIPPLCKLNPLYEEVVGLRFRALCYLADDCGEDITALI
jgi:Mo-dependent nitrogenase C-terminus